MKIKKRIDMDKKLMDYLQEEGYSHFREVPDKGLCAVRQMTFTTGVFYGVDEFSYIGRYCYKHHSDAIKALAIWDGMQDPPGPWIKHKGVDIDMSNPNPSDE